MYLRSIHFDLMKFRISLILIDFSVTSVTRRNGQAVLSYAHFYVRCGTNKLVSFQFSKRPTDYDFVSSTESVVDRYLRCSSLQAIVLTFSS